MTRFDTCSVLQRVSFWDCRKLRHVPLWDCRIMKHVAFCDLSQYATCSKLRRVSLWDRHSSERQIGMGKADRPKLLISLKKSRGGGIPRGGGADSRHYTPHNPTPSKNNLVLQNRTTLPIKLRDPSDGDWNYIYDSWKRSFKEMMPWVPTSNFFRAMGERVEAIKGRRETRFFIACDPEDEEFIFGWGCFGRKNLIHYVFVKQAFRHAQVATRLVDHATNTSKPIAFTHWTRICEKLSKKHPGALRYEPSKLPKS